MANPALIRVSQDFKAGYTHVTKIGENSLDTGIEFGILKLSPNGSFEETSPFESVWVLMSGKIEATFDEGTWSAERLSLFDEGPNSIHLSKGKKIKFKSGKTPVELAVAKTKNDLDFESRIFSGKNLETEYRGEGLVQGTCLREVRQIFDKKSRPQSNLVIGEVVNYPGRWSSYPPHHHNQPEIYHYRFTETQGYGHAELGEDVYKIKNNDTIKILNNLDHSQVSAPGYGMYYLWVIRHLPNNPYLGFEFTQEHKWILDPRNQGWIPRKKT